MAQILNQNLKEFLLNIIEEKKSKSGTNILFELLNYKAGNVNSSNKKLVESISDPFVFSQGESGLWYNWATSVGKDLVAISYSAGTTYIFNNSGPLTRPQIQIFCKDQISVTNTSEPLAQITLEQEQGIRSLLLVDDCGLCPYLLIGTFSYPTQGVEPECKLLKWSFTKSKLTTVFTIPRANSIRRILRYKHDCQDYIVFSTQTDSKQFDEKCKIYYLEQEDLRTKCSNYFAYKYLKFDSEILTGSVWDIFIDCKTLYISVPKISPDPEKLSGFNTRGRLFYCKIDKLFKKDSSNLNLLSIVGNEQYPAGFEINSVSAFQVETNPDTNTVYIYTLSDFLYQILSLSQSSSLEQILSNDVNDLTTLIEFIILIRGLVSNLDIQGSKILSFDKKDLYKEKPPLITTVVGDPVYNSLNKSKTSDGYNNFANVYTWCSTSRKNNFYFGTLDLRSGLYTSLVYAVASIFGIPEIIPIFLSLPEDLIILITEFAFDPDFALGTNIDFSDKKLYFDIIHIDSKTGLTNKITSSGFSPSQTLSPVGDDGCRNLNIISNDSGKYLLVGTTCYQQSNSAKVFTLKI